MDRTKAIFETVFNLPSAAKSGKDYDIKFIPVEDALDPGVLKVRMQREHSSLQTFLSETRHSWTSLSDLHRWIFTKHASYSAVRFTDQYTF